MQHNKHVDGAVIVDLVAGELDYRHAGVCTVTATNGTPREVIVLGENEHILKRIPLDTDDERCPTKESNLDGHDVVVDEAAVAEAVNRAINNEMDAL